MVIPRDQTNPRRGERGSAVLLALVTAIVLSMGVLLVAGMIQSRRAAFDVERRNVTLTALADAAATALANRVIEPEDIEPTLDVAKSTEGLKGALVVLRDRMGVWGPLELVRLNH